MKKLFFSIFILVILGIAFFYSQKNNSSTIVDLLKTKKNLDGFYFENKFNTEYIILNYWASWCPPCIAETPSLIKFVISHEKQFKLFAISQDSNLKDIDDFIKTFPRIRNENVEIIWDDNKELSRKLHVEKLPETFIYELRTHKILKISGSTNWEDPEFLKYIENYFTPTSQKDNQ